jgi:hypothetical protein
MVKGTRGVQDNKRKRINNKTRLQYDDPLILSNE